MRVRSVSGRPVEREEGDMARFLAALLVLLAVAAAGITVAVGMALLRAWQLWRDGVHGVWEKSGS